MPHNHDVFWQGFESFFKWWNVYINILSVTPVLWRTKYWHQPVNNHRCCLKIHKIVFHGKKKHIKGALSIPFTANTHFACNIYKPVCLQNRISFCILMLASSTWLLLVMVTGVMLIGWGSHVILVHVIWVRKEIRKSTEGLWLSIYSKTCVKWPLSKSLNIAFQD